MTKVCPGDDSSPTGSAGGVVPGSLREGPSRPGKPDECESGGAGRAVKRAFRAGPSNTGERQGHGRWRTPASDTVAVGLGRSQTREGHVRAACSGSAATAGISEAEGCRRPD
jgi:hypothetical protein